jgi:hypothetical protein
MAFERFTAKGKSFQPKISLRKNGHIGFNQAAIDKFQLMTYKYAVLFYDRENKIIGIKPTNEAEEGARSLRVKETNAYVAARTFMDCFSIPYALTERYNATWDDDEQMIVASI